MKAPGHAAESPGQRHTVSSWSPKRRKSRRTCAICAARGEPCAGRRPEWFPRLEATGGEDNRICGSGRGARHKSGTGSRRKRRRVDDNAAADASHGGAWRQPRRPAGRGAGPGRPAAIAHRRKSRRCSITRRRDRGPVPVRHCERLSVSRRAAYCPTHKVSRGFGRSLCHGESRPFRIVPGAGPYFFRATFSEFFLRSRQILLQSRR